MSNIPQADLISKLGQKYDEYMRDSASALKRAESEAYEQAALSLLTSEDSFRRFEESAMAAASVGQKTCRLLTWQSRGPQFNRLFLSDMLDTGDLLTRLQGWLDANYGVGNFRIFNHHIKFSRNSYALVVSWDIDKFDSVTEILAANRKQRVASANEWDLEMAEPRETPRSPQSSRPPRSRARAHQAPRTRRPQPDEELVDQDEPQYTSPPPVLPQRRSILFKRR